MGGLSRYIILRIIMAAFTIFMLITFVFFLLRVLPGDPVLALLGPEAPLDLVEEIRHELGLDRPLHVQYVSYLKDILSGNLGHGYRGRPVIDDVKQKLPATIELTIASVIIAWSFGLVGGILSAMNKDGIIDRLIWVSNLLWYALPAFWIGLMMQVLFGMQLNLLPMFGRYSGSISQATRITGFLLLDSILAGDFKLLLNVSMHLVLPALCLGLKLTPALIGVTRAEIINTLEEDYILTARAKGLSRFKVVYKHALRNVLLPLITMMGMQFASLLGGVLIVETVFNFPGMGLLLVDAMYERSYPVIQGVLVFSAVWVGVAGASIDILYGFIDPRVRMGSSNA